MPNPGDVVTVDFTGATGVKRRPAIVVSSGLYHSHRPDVILGALTTRLADATTPTDYILQDWAAAGLHRASAFRAYLGMAVASKVQVIGRLSGRDWQAVQGCLGRALALSAPSGP
jgi:mRNA interferase MazF